ncbi:MAG: hypothetical protein IT373_34265 [Polyangiaceae bacterium]|nr:hypothetical protein [Polyangiaceae bacterium]
MSRSPYREAADRIVGAAEDLSPDRSLRVLDASGRPGRAGAAGPPGADGYGAGADGRRGGDAGPAEAGQHAGRIAVRLGSEADGVLRLRAEGVRADGVAAALDELVDFGDAGYVDVVARGGRGGDGGVGGRGGDGARGYRGSDATRYSSGGNGGPGGDGGAGGDGTSGAPGGSGGEIRVRVADDDTHLLMLLRHDVGGGDGGQPGRNGGGGSGGSGGAGGSSHSWTTTSTYTDSQGRQQSRTHFHSNPGGSSGPRGSDGPAGRAALAHGAHGRDGAFVLEVEAGERVERYGSRYHLELASFRHDNENGDGIYEPEEKVRVFDIALANMGGMPTPRTRDVELTLERRGWVRPLAEKITLPKGIAAGASHLCAGEALSFQIGDFVPQGPGDALRAEEQIGLVATVPAARRRFEGFDAEAGPRAGRFVIQFPVQASTIESLCALAPGQAARVRFALCNVSGRAFGSASELGRAVRVRLVIERSELRPGEVILYDDRGRACGDEGFVHDLPRIEPGATVAFEVAVAVGASAEHYRAVTLWLVLELGTIAEPARLRPVQIGAFEVRVAARYVARPDADLLLVVNHGTRREVLDAWHAAARTLGLELAVWDLSLEGALDFAAPVAGGPSLGETFAGKTVVVLDNSITTAEGPSHPHRFCSKADLHALVRAGTRVLLLGAGTSLEGLVLPTLGATPAAAGQVEPERALAVVPHRSSADVGAALVAAGSSGAGGAPVVVDEQVTRSRWYRPAEAELVRRAHERAHELMAALPERRFTIVPRFDPAVVKRGWLWHRYTLGALELHPGLDRQGGLLDVRVGDDALADPELPTERSTLLALLLARPFEDRLARLVLLAERAIELGAGAAPAPAGDAADAGALAPAEADGEEGERPAPADAARAATALVRVCVDALLVDLLHEQQTVLASPWRAGMKRTRRAAALPKLGALAARPFAWTTPPAPGSLVATELLRLAARLSFFAQSQVDWWEHVPPFRFWRRAPAAAVLGRASVEGYLAHVFGSDAALDAARARLKAALRRLRQSYARRRKADAETPPRAEHARRLLAAPLERDGLTADLELGESAAERVVGADEFAAACERDRKRAAVRRRLERAQRGQQARLLLPETAAELARRGA